MGAAETMLDQIDGVVVHVDAKTLGTTYANAAVRGLVGEEPEHWTARPDAWRNLFDEEDWPRVARVCRAVARDGRRRRVQHLMRLRAGRPRWFRTSVSLLADAPSQVLVAHMLDVTDDEPEDDIARQQAWAREIFRQAPLAVFLIDRKGVVRLAEGKGLARMGIEPGHTLGRSMLQGRWSCPWIVENARRALEGEAFSDVRGVDRGWLSLKYIPVRDRRGRLEGALGFATDITECKLAVDLIGAVDAVLWQIHGPHRQVSFVGGSPEKIFGPPADEWLWQPDFLERHLLESERKTVLAAIDAVAADGRQRTIVHRIHPSAGPDRWCRTTLRRMPAGGPPDVVGLMLDITERRVAERALSARDRRWQLVAEQAPIIVYTTDRELRFTSGLGAGMTALGLRSNGTLIGVSLEEYFQASRAAQELIDAHRRALEGEAVRTETAWLGRTMELALEPLRSDGDGIVGVIGVALDVTEQKEHQRQRDRLLEAERDAHLAAERAVRLRDQFLSVASHELRTPLASLTLVLQAMLRQARDDQGPPDLIRRLDLASRQVQRLASLIDQLLEASRLGAGQPLLLEREEVDLVALVRQVVDRFEPELVSSKTVVDISGSERVVGAWDRSRLDQLLTNLLGNAIKYGSGRPVKISVEPAGHGRARLSVRDQGIGIAREDLPLIFEPFKRLHDARHYGGFGLGLFIVAEIVRAHEGEVRVDSEPGQGACFVVELPVQPPAPISAGAASP